MATDLVEDWKNDAMTMPTNSLPRTFITGTAGFIGFHTARLLLSKGFTVAGYDGMTNYYDVNLKQRRHAELSEYPEFSATAGMLEDQSRLDRAVDDFAPDVVIHLAAQAGVRHSLENPRDYLNANIIGTFNVMEAARRTGVKHLLMASSSSVYGANDGVPFAETDKADLQLSTYAATKKATESLAHANAHLWRLPTTMFRCFTVYGPWGRPDLVLHRFVDAIIDGRPIDIYNNGEMFRDFTFVGDVARAIHLLIEARPLSPMARREVRSDDSLSPVAPYRVVNIGSAERVGLLEVIACIEHCLGKKASRNYMPMQAGDVSGSQADNSLLHALVGYRPQTDFRLGLAQFVEWFRGYYQK